MTVLEIIAEQKLGPKVLDAHPALRAALQKTDNSIRAANATQDEKARVGSLVELCAAYQAEIRMGRIDGHTQPYKQPPSGAWGMIQIRLQASPLELGK